MENAPVFQYVLEKCFQVNSKMLYAQKNNLPKSVLRELEHEMTHAITELGLITFGSVNDMCASMRESFTDDMASGTVFDVIVSVSLKEAARKGLVS